jgi:redox-regulated HSP33 family molecular chaperone
MIVKTKQNPLGSFRIGYKPLKIVDKFEDLIKTPANHSSVLQGIADESLLDDSELLSIIADKRIADYTATIALATGANISTWQNTYFKNNVQMPTFVKAGYAILQLRS